MRNKFFLFLLLFPHFPPYLPLPNPNWDIMIPRGNDYILGNKGVKWWNLKSNFTKSCKNTYFAYPLDCLPSILLPCPPPFLSYHANEAYTMPHPLSSVFIPQHVMLDGFSPFSGNWNIQLFVNSASNRLARARLSMSPKKTGDTNHSGK